MKSILHHIAIPLSLLLLVIAIIASCSHKRQDYSSLVLEKMGPDVTATLDFNSLSSLNEANKKVIDISTLIYSQNKAIPNLDLILKVKEDQHQTDRDLKELSKENLIVIPRPFYRLKLNKDSLRNKNSTKYLVKLMIREIDVQIDLLETIKDTTTNSDFRSFAAKSATILKQNQEDLAMSFKL